MDTITQASQQAIADLAENGGGTYHFDTMAPFTPADGFAVGIGGINLPADDTNAERLAWGLRTVAAEFGATLAGTWLNEGKVYIDAVMYFPADQRDRAMAAGRYYCQLAIFDFGSKESIDL